MLPPKFDLLSFHLSPEAGKSYWEKETSRGWAGGGKST
jgi:hypothetical protein